MGSQYPIPSQLNQRLTYQKTKHRISLNTVTVPDNHLEHVHCVGAWRPFPYRQAVPAFLGIFQNLFTLYKSPSPISSSQFLRPSTQFHPLIFLRLLLLLNLHLRLNSLCQQTPISTLQPLFHCSFKLVPQIYSVHEQYHIISLLNTVTKFSYHQKQSKITKSPNSDPTDSHCLAEIHLRQAVHHRNPENPKMSHFYPRRLAVQPTPPGASSNRPRFR